MPLIDVPPKNNKSQKLLSFYYFYTIRRLSVFHYTKKDHWRINSSDNHVNSDIFYALFSHVIFHSSSFQYNKKRFFVRIKEISNLKCVHAALIAKNKCGKFDGQKMMLAQVALRFVSRH